MLVVTTYPDEKTLKGLGQAKVSAADCGPGAAALQKRGCLRTSKDANLMQSKIWAMIPKIFLILIIIRLPANNAPRRTCQPSCKAFLPPSVKGHQQPAKSMDRHL